MSFVFTSLPVILFILLVKLPFFLVRWLRWLGFAQQKEYRLDRLFAFLRSDEGSAELQRILPKKSEFSRVGMKRPRITPRVLVVAVGSFVLLGALLLISFMIIASFIAGMFWQVLMGALVIGGAYLILPGIVILACFPSALVSAIVIYKTLKTAQRKIQKGSPKIIGLGGSYGKTSTKHLLHHFLSQNATVFVTPKSFNTKYSMAKSICEGYTGQEIALLEYGAYVIGEIEYMTEWFQPHMAVETGFTPQHLSLFGSRENSLNAESELVAALPTDAVVFCNGADQGAVEICERGRAQNNAKIIMYAGEKSAVQLKNLELNEFGQVSVEWNGKRLQTQLIGKQYMGADRTASSRWRCAGVTRR